MKVSIIIPIRNEELVLEKIVRQLENKLRNMPYEIVFVNDFSQDNTFSILEKLLENKNHFKLYNNKKKGLGGAITEGINKSTGELNPYGYKVNDALNVALGDMGEEGSLNKDSMGQLYNFLRKIFY